MRLIKAFVFTLILTLSVAVEVQSKIDPEVRKKVLEANDEAVRVLKAYSQNQSNSLKMRTTAGLMAELLNRAAVAPAVKDILESCNKNLLIEAKADWISQVISICPSGLRSEKNDLIQTLIHESYHLYEGIYYYPSHQPDLYKKLLTNKNKTTPFESEDSEKRAAAIEIEIMSKTYGCVFYDSLYFKKLLNLELYQDYVICR